MRKNYRQDSPCPICGKYFNYLGIASHRAAHKRKKKPENNPRLKKNRYINYHR